MTAPLHSHPLSALPFNMGFAVALVVVLFAGMVVCGSPAAQIHAQQAPREPGRLDHREDGRKIPRRSWPPRCRA